MLIAGLIANVQLQDLRRKMMEIKSFVLIPNLNLSNKIPYFDPVKTFVSISLAFFVLFSTVGMAKTTHFCMGHAMKSELGFGEKHLDCGMAMPMGHSENEPDNQKDPNSCCENITEHLQVDEDVQLKKSEIKLDLNFALALAQVFIFGVDASPKENPKLPHYLSPPPVEDLHILYETYLI